MMGCVCLPRVKALVVSNGNPNRSGRGRVERKDPELDVLNANGVSSWCDSSWMGW